jgi:hypothetical protein
MALLWLLLCLIAHMTWQAPVTTMALLLAAALLRYLWRHASYSGWLCQQAR